MIDAGALEVVAAPIDLRAIACDVVEDHRVVHHGGCAIDVGGDELGVGAGGSRVASGRSSTTSCPTP